MSDDEIGRLERKAAGDSEFGSVEEAERAERSYKREARMLRRKADEFQESGDSDAADRFDASADDAEKNAGCCRAFIRSAAHKEAGEKGNCESCGKPNFLCKGCGKDDADDKDASAEGDEGSAEKTADHDVQAEPNLKNDAKGVAVTGKPSPNNNTKASKKADGDCDKCDCDPCECKKAAAGCCDKCDCDPCECKKAAADCEKCDCDPCECKKASSKTKPLAESLREQHLATAKMYRKMADEAEEGGDFVKADTFDHKAEVCEDLSKDAAIETANPEPELAGVNDATGISESVEREASGGASTEDTDGPSEGSAKTASAEDNGEIEITDDLIEAAVTPREVFELRSASNGQRRREPSRVDPNASGVTRIASCDENAASNDPDISALESLWEGAPRE